jgi:hypothetical protein
MQRRQEYFSECVRATQEVLGHGFYFFGRIWCIYLSCVQLSPGEYKIFSFFFRMSHSESFIPFGMQDTSNTDNVNFDDDFSIGSLFDEVRNGVNEDPSNVEPGDLDINQVGLFNLVLLVCKNGTSNLIFLSRKESGLLPQMIPTGLR